MERAQSADAVFALLSDESRVDILRAVAIAQNEEELPGDGETALSFSDIYERVDVDNTPKLSYHLGELAGTFLRKHENGYSFTHTGEQMVRFILAENYRPPSEFEPIETDGTCLYCGESALEATLREQYFIVSCSACDSPIAGYTVTPAQTRAHDGADLVASLTRKQATDYGLVQRGICPECSGHVETDVIDVAELPRADSVPFSLYARQECQQCLRVYGGPLTHTVAYHTASVAFHWDHGVDATGTGMWEFNHHLLAGDWTAERRESDPVAYEVVLRRGDDALRAFLDESARITRTERVRSQDVD